MGYCMSGFHDIVGVDIHPQPNFPFDFEQGDAFVYVEKYGHLFDAIHASPPCQVHSVTAASVRGRGLTPRFSDLVPQTRGWLELLGKPYVIENVVGAHLLDPIILCGEMFGLGVIRHRAFESNIYLTQPPHIPHRPGGTNSSKSKTWAGKGQSSHLYGAVYITVAGNNYVLSEGLDAMGISWMATRSELSEAIPPAYTCYIGNQVISYIRAQQ